MKSNSQAFIDRFSVCHDVGYGINNLTRYCLESDSVLFSHYWQAVADHG